MKKMRKLMSALLAMSMVFTVLVASASAAAPDTESEFNPEGISRIATPSTEIDLNTTMPTLTIPFNIVDGYNWWKIAIQTSTSGICYNICKATGEVVYESDEVPTGNSFEHGNLPTGNYLLQVRVKDGSHGLQGTLWYKTATTENEVKY